MDSAHEIEVRKINLVWVGSVDIYFFNLIITSRKYIEKNYLLVIN